MPDQTTLVDRYQLTVTDGQLRELAAAIEAVDQLEEHARQVSELLEGILLLLGEHLPPPRQLELVRDLFPPDGGEGGS